MSTEFGRRLKLARAHARLSQIQLARTLGISQGTVSEAEIKGYGSSHVVRMAQACGVSPVWLASGEGDMVEGPPTAGPLHAREESPPYAVPPGSTGWLRRLGAELARLPPEHRDAAAGLLASWARSGGEDVFIPLIAALLDKPRNSR